MSDLLSRQDLPHPVNAIVPHLSRVLRDRFQIKAFTGIHHLARDQIPLFVIVFDFPVDVILAVLKMNFPLFRNDLMHAFQIVQQVQ